METRKSLADILDRIEIDFKKAEKDLIENNCCVNEISARERILVDLIGCYGTWKQKGDCIPFDWIKQVYLKVKTI